MHSTHAAALPQEVEVYPYAALPGLPGRSLLVFAPHPDDEVFGCGGTLARAVDAGAAVHVVVITGGDLGGDAPTRRLESRAAATVLAAGGRLGIEFWNEPDRGLVLSEQLVLRMRAAIAASAADWVLAPSPYEIHPDHRIVCLAAAEAFSRSFSIDSPARLAFFEVGHPLFPTHLVDITPVAARKAKAMDCFVSQLARQRYDEHVLALNRFRSYTLDPAVTHAEALQVVTPEALRDGLAPLLRAVADGVDRRLGLDPARQGQA